MAFFKNPISLSLFILYISVILTFTMSCNSGNSNTNLVNANPISKEDLNALEQFIEQEQQQQQQQQELENDDDYQELPDDYEEVELDDEEFDDDDEEEEEEEEQKPKIDPNTFVCPKTWFDSEELVLDNMGLTEIPKDFSRLHHLKSISLKNNFIHSYESLSNLKNIQTLRNINVEGNPVEFLRFNHQVIVKSILPQLEYFNGKKIHLK